MSVKPMATATGCLLLMLFSSLAAAQSRVSTGVPRTPWGHPDLQGIWDYWTFTPLERPGELSDRPVLTEEEAARRAEQLYKRALQTDSSAPARGDTGAYSQEVWTDRAKATALTQSSLIVDPPDGKVPSLTPEALKNAETDRAAGGRPVRVRTGGIGADGPEDRGVAERCILGFSTGPPMLPAGYNNNVQIFQTPEHVVLLLEMNHDARIIPLDGRPHLGSGMRQWMGDSRAHWDGNTLVVQTTNFTDKTASFALTGQAWGSAARLQLTERFTRLDRERLSYEFTVNDPATFSRPFTGRFPMKRSQQPLYEYACHEGNYGMLNMLSGARAQESARGK